MSGPENDGASDEALARAAAAGDRQALERLLERHADRVHSICRRVTANPHDALDATQEALIAVARRIGSFDGRARFTTWLYRVATNAALDEVRRRSRRPAPVDASVPGVAGETSSGFEGAVDARLDVDGALAGVAPDFRVAVVLRDLCDLEYEEIAAVLGVPIGTVRSRIARGRAALADRLAESPPVTGNPATAHRRPRRREP
ncbi:MAG TPA: sigma-70 family RNA polymerase sigma factor [Acidimicrobiia bacterium]|nr:sigma-70 family RNA polymerase sigma factor [Acidimicrobiia bacterium]